jgi:hypothetical protein
MGCSECPSPVEHLPEECPAATTYIVYGNGACEAAFLRTTEGRQVTATHRWGTVAYEAAVIAGTELMHMVGACPL